MGRNFKANCPFHSEKTPSFVVSPERQIWHCFGCQKGGDCFTFLMEYERLEFPEAIRILAQKAGIELLRTGFDSGAASKKELIYSLNILACEFYNFVLTKHKAGEKALFYLLNERKITPQIINTFKIGFSPKIGDALSNYLIQKKKYQKEDLIESGLSIYRNGRISDFFLNRIMFPLYDHRGNIVGFSGRVLSDNLLAGGSKYVNTRETLAYHKSDVFFGLNISKEAIKKENNAVIMEGEFDVIASFMEGIANTVAIKGTALTESQVNLIARYSQKVSLCFDQDDAGIEATKRSLSFLEKKGLTATVVLIPNGKDPDESIKANPVDFKKAVKNSVGIYDYLLDLSLNKFDKKTIDGKRKISDEFLPVLSLIENEIVKEHYLKKLSEEISTSYESILKEAEKISKPKSKIAAVSVSGKKRERREMLEEYLLALIVQGKNQKILLEKTKEMLAGIDFKISSYGKIIDRLSIFFKNQEVFDSEKFSRALPLELVPSFDICFLFPLSKFSDEEVYQEEVDKTMKELKILDLKEKIKNVSDKIKEKEKDGEDHDLAELNDEFSGLIALLKNHQK